MSNNIELMIITFIIKRPLKPSIKFAPLVINKKQSSINNVEKNLFFYNEFKKIKSILKISIGNKLINILKKMIINNSLMVGLIFVLMSSK